jgi:predicted Zn finger-like uncharacterized protein
MNIRCPQCQTVFKVDPSRIPQGGARARCARCGNRFMVRPPATTTDPSTGSTPVVQPPRTPTPSHSPPTHAPPPRPPAGYGSRPAAATTPAGPTPAAAVADRTSSQSVGGARPLGSKDPSARAERLARALVSDIVAYHPDRHEKSLGDGTLRTEFREEIMKSWDEYVAQVGMNVAKSTPYFRDALNRILAKGQQLF